MRALAKSIRELFRGLYRSWGGRFSAADEKGEIGYLKRIGELREPAAVPALVGILYNGTEAARELAAETIEQIVRVCDSVTLAQLDGAVRDLSEWRFPSLTRDGVLQVSRGLIGPLGMISFGSSGYTREAAVVLLAGDHSGMELPFLIIRLKDWVREVRGAAERAVVERIRPNYAEHFVRCLPLISILRGRKRSDHGGIFEVIEELLRGERCSAAAAEGDVGGGSGDTASGV